MTELQKKRCKPCEGGVEVLDLPKAQQLLQKLPGWQLKAEGRMILRHFQFENFHATMAFVNAIAWIAHREDHHPDLEVGYDYCRVQYSTHAINGLSENDFICAAKIDQLMI